MKLVSLFKTIFHVTLIAPSLSFRVGEMALASIQVITLRTIGLAKLAREPKSGDKRELLLMVREKFDGMQESVTAGIKHMGMENWSMISGSSSQKYFSKLFSLPFSSRSPLELVVRFISLSISAGNLLILSSMRAYLSGFKFFKATTDPLRSRVIANARRLGKERNGQLRLGLTRKIR